MIGELLARGSLCGLLAAIQGEQEKIKRLRELKRLSDEIKKEREDEG